MTIDLEIIISRLLSRLWALSFYMTRNINNSKYFANEHLLLSNRSGAYKIICEMEDMVFRMLHPDQYEKIALLFGDKKVELELFIESTLIKIRYILKRYGIKAEISGRLKHIYSIWNKMRVKNVDFDKLYDLRAVRIVVDDVRTCYMVLDIIHKLWSHIPEEFDDYIAKPKLNGYQSLHTVVMDKDNYLIEIQIRTGEMHNFAEYGFAAHWCYKKFGNVSANKVCSNLL